MTKFDEPDDLEDLNNTSALTFTIQANCVTGHFSHDTSPTATEGWLTHLEEWVLWPNGGAVGGMAPAHLTSSFQLDTILKPFYEGLYGKDKQRLVAELDARLRASMHDLNDIVQIRSFVLLADPATRLAVPAPTAPTMIRVDPAGDRAIEVEWSAVGDASTYRLYRSLSPTRGFVAVADNLTSTSYTDTGLSNCTPHYYYVVAVDGDGFESTWSNDNASCVGGGGPAEGCWSATPENPVPPSKPVMVSVEDLERGGQLHVRWQAVPESDVTVYRVTWRRDDEPGFDAYKDVAAPALDTTLFGLTDGVLYHVAVQARNCSNAGPLSDALTGTPHLVRGLNPPEPVDDLRVLKAGADLRLEWSTPSQSVWGTESTVQGVEVYGSATNPDFPADASHRWASLGAGAISWLDNGQNQASAGQERYYLIVARDGDGLGSAAGSGLPASVDDLRLTRESGQLRLTWTAVSRTMSSPGHPSSRIAITGYNVYGRASTLPRAECAAANRLAADVPQVIPEVTLLVPEPSEGYYCYQVLAEDSHQDESVW